MIQTKIDTGSTTAIYFDFLKRPALMETSVKFPQTFPPKMGGNG